MIEDKPLLNEIEFTFIQEGNTNGTITGDGDEKLQ